MTKKKTDREFEHHGETTGGQSPLYRIWAAIKQRCCNKKSKRYKDYGGRGIDMDPLWRDSFGLFRLEILKRIGKRPGPKFSLGRINQKKGFWIDNVRWVGIVDLARNTRRNHLVFWKGNWMTLSQLAEQTGIDSNTLQRRLSVEDLSVEEAVRRPVEGGTRYIEWKGEYHSISTWARKLGINVQTLYSRIHKMKWPLEQCMVPGDNRRKERREMASKKASGNQG